LSKGYVPDAFCQVIAPGQWAAKKAGVAIFLIAGSAFPISAEDQKDSNCPGRALHITAFSAAINAFRVRR
jgi:hypothetical protein